MEIFSRFDGFLIFNCHQNRRQTFTSCKFTISLLYFILIYILYPKSRLWLNEHGYAQIGFYSFIKNASIVEIYNFWSSFFGATYMTLFIIVTNSDFVYKQRSYKLGKSESCETCSSDRCMQRHASCSRSISKDFWAHKHSAPPTY